MATAKKTAPADPAAKPARRATAAKQVDAAVAPDEEPVGLLGQAGEKVRNAANSGKDRATGAMDDLAAMVEDVAKSIDEKLGPHYGDYARKAAEAVSGVSGDLKAKDVDQLVDDARDFVRKRPAVAIGAAAAVGFLLTRLFKAGENDEA